MKTSLYSATCSASSLCTDCKKQFYEFETNFIFAYQINHDQKVHLVRSSCLVLLPLHAFHRSAARGQLYWLEGVNTLLTTHGQIRDL